MKKLLVIILSAILLVAVPVVSKSPKTKTTTQSTVKVKKTKDDRLSYASVLRETKAYKDLGVKVYVDGNNYEELYFQSRRFDKKVAEDLLNSKPLQKELTNLGFTKFQISNGLDKWYVFLY